MLRALPAGREATEGGKRGRIAAVRCGPPAQRVGRNTGVGAGWVAARTIAWSTGPGNPRRRSFAPPRPRTSGA